MYNRYIVVPLLVWAITQFTKFVVGAARGDINFKYLYASGGMPSVHAAVVSSLVITSLVVDGINSSIFGVVVILAAIVMYDSFGVRRSAGEQAVAINALIERSGISNPPERLREILGHKPLEVSVGAAMGIILGCLFNYDRIGALIAVITTNVTLGVTYSLAAGGILLLIIASLARWLFFRGYPRVKEVKKASSRISITLWLIGLLGVLVAFLQYERVTASQWAIWQLVYVVIVIGATVSLYVQYSKSIPAVLQEYRSEQDKQKWFEGPNKKRRAGRAKRR